MKTVIAAAMAVLLFYRNFLQIHYKKKHIVSSKKQSMTLCLLTDLKRTGKILHKKM